MLRCLQKQEKFRTPQDAVIAAFISHPRRDVIHRTDDLALIKFEEPVYFTNFVRPACIVPESFNKVRKAIVSGWGVTKRSKCRRKSSLSTYVPRSSTRHEPSLRFAEFSKKPIRSTHRALRQALYPARNRMQSTVCKHTCQICGNQKNRA